MVSILFLQWLFFFLMSVAANPVAPIVTAPTILPRDGATTSDDFVGYYWDVSETESLTSASCYAKWKFTSSESRAGCCPTVVSDDFDYCARSIVTSCIDSTVALYGGGVTWHCGSSSTCGTNTIYLGSNTDASSLLLIQCGKFDPQIYFRETPAEASASVTELSTPVNSHAPPSEPAGASAPLETSGNVGTSWPLGASGTSKPTKSSESREPSRRSSTALQSQSAVFVGPLPATVRRDTSKAWVAGIVVGAVALLGIVGMAFWMLRMRKRNQEQIYQPAPQTVHAPPPSFVSGLVSPLHDSSSLSPYRDHRGSYTPTLRSELHEPQMPWKHQSTTSLHSRNLSTPPQAMLQNISPEDLPELVSPPTSALR